MGYNTACIILNDYLHDIAERGDVGRSIQSSVLTASRAERGDHPHYTPGFQALPSVHADVVQIVAVGGNQIVKLGYGHWQDEPEALLRRLAEQMGFRLVRKVKT